MTSPFMEAIAADVAGRGITVHRFEFAYMASRRHGAARRPPPPVARLADEYRMVAATLRRQSYRPFLIGGKSMGGRIASMIAADLFDHGLTAGCVCLGYPFHPAGQPARLRIDHLVEGADQVSTRPPRSACPILIVQGERDPLGSRAEVEHYPLAPYVRLHWLPDGDHDLAPRRSSGLTQAGHIAAAAAAIAGFLDEIGR